VNPLHVGRPDRIGPFLIERELGRGGMGVVYLATQSGLNRHVALKVLSAELAGDKEFVARFHHEAEILASLDSPHVIAIFDHGTADGVVYLATQYVTGGDLGVYLATHGPLSTIAALDVFGQILEGLGDAHARGVIHRDIKPGNVLLRGDRKEPYIYLADFGIAQLQGVGGQTRAGTVVGSTAYLAPERHLGQMATVQSDIYATGCVLWAMLTGSTPYAGTEFQQALGHTSGVVPQLAGTDGVAAALNDLLAWTLAKDPTDRPQNAAQVLTKAREVSAQLVADDRTHVRPMAAGAATRRDPNVDSLTDWSTEERTHRRTVPDHQVPEQGPSPRPRRVLPAILAASVGLVIVGVTAAVLTQQTSTNGTAGRLPTQRSDPARPTQTADRTTSSPRPAIVYACWDGAPVSDPSACSSPTNAREATAYLSYVFPNQATVGTKCSVKDSSKGYRGLTVYRACSFGHGVDVVTRYWANGGDATGLYDDRFKGNTKGGYTLYVGGEKTDGWVKTTKRRVESPPRMNLVASWGDDHLSISIFAPSEQDLWKSLAKLHAVAPEQLLGYPQGTGGANAGPVEAR